MPSIIPGRDSIVMSAMESWYGATRDLFDALRAGTIDEAETKRVAVGLARCITGLTPLNNWAVDPLFRLYTNTESMPIVVMPLSEMDVIVAFDHSTEANIAKIWISSPGLGIDAEGNDSSDSFTFSPEDIRDAARMNEIRRGLDEFISGLPGETTALDPTTGFDTDPLYGDVPQAEPAESEENDTLPENIFGDCSRSIENILDRASNNDQANLRPLLSTEVHRYIQELLGRAIRRNAVSTSRNETFSNFRTSVNIGEGKKIVFKFKHSDINSFYLSVFNNELELMRTGGYRVSVLENPDSVDLLVRINEALNRPPVSEEAPNYRTVTDPVYRYDLRD